MSAKYHFVNEHSKPMSFGEEPRGKKRARAEDFL